MSNNQRTVSPQAGAVLNLWQAIEYLGPQKPPKVSAKDCVWAVHPKTPDAQLPWHDQQKNTLLKAKYKKWRFHVFSGIADGMALVDEARDALGATAATYEERMPPSPAACVVIETDAAGMATGQVFVSTVAWAMSKIVAHAGQGGALDFSGFFGYGNVEEDIRAQVTDLLVARQLLPSPATASGATAATVARATSPGTAPSSDLRSTRPNGSPEPDAAAHGSAAGQLRPMTATDIDIVTRLVFTMCGWLPTKQLPWRIKGVSVSDKDIGAKKVQDDPLNSFFTDDLERVNSALAHNNYGAGLRIYLQDEDPAGRIDLECSRSTMIDAVHPSRHPNGCWPATYPLVTAQQFSVNTLYDELKLDGIFSVNGPPGTGKTTMLKDIIAAVVTDRADVLVEIEKPMSAFGTKLDIDHYQYGAPFMLDERLRGFGMVVASANNGAVENITKDLPGLKSIDSDINLDYFSALAESLGASAHATKREPEVRCWGLISAVLGNKTNRNQFANRFWFEDAKTTAAQDQPSATPPDPQRLRSLPSLIAQGDHGALSWEEAQGRYRAAKKKVNDLVAAATAAMAAMALLRAATSRARSIQDQRQALVKQLCECDRAIAAAAPLALLESDLLRASQQLDIVQSACQAHHHAMQATKRLQSEQSNMPAGGVAATTAACDEARERLEDIGARRQQHMAAKPGVMSELLRLPSSRRWNALGEQIDAEWNDIHKEEKTARTLRDHALHVAAALAVLGADVQQAEQKLALARITLRRAGIDEAASLADLEARYRNDIMQATERKQHAQQLQKNARATRDAIDVHDASAAEIAQEIIQHKNCISALTLSEKELPTWDLAQLERADFHRATPYCMQTLFQARSQLFVAAMELHKAFICASWIKLRPTLQAFISLLTGGVNPGQIKQGVSPLWDAFFLVVPVVSTAFASFSRLFVGMGREQLAWLMIDEAGQANPQHAAGAIWRAKRSIVVGDPLQLEPVTTIPQEIVAALLDRSGVGKQWAPPIASVQVLADRSNRYGTYHGEPDQSGRIWLGSPLVVHRRCLDPMFSIANRIAYNNMMVYGTADDKNPGDARSTWHHVPAVRGAEMDGHWIETQGNIALQLVRDIVGPAPHGHLRDKVFVITPFKKVSEKIGELLEQEYKGASSGMSGTVHTFQGKEADTVIFLLGGSPATPGVISTFAGARPNLVNVAVTRAKRRLYVVGDLQYWTGPDDVLHIYSRMAQHLPMVKRTGASREAIPARTDVLLEK